MSSSDDRKKGKFEVMQDVMAIHWPVLIIFLLAFRSSEMGIFCFPSCFRGCKYCILVFIYCCLDLERMDKEFSRLIIYIL